jgi:hypothetical protein
MTFITNDLLKFNSVIFHVHKRFILFKSSNQLKPKNSYINRVNTSQLISDRYSDKA